MFFFCFLSFVSFLFFFFAQFLHFVGTSCAAHLSLSFRRLISIAFVVCCRCRLPDRYVGDVSLMSTFVWRMWMRLFIDIFKLHGVHKIQNDIRATSSIASKVNLINCIGNVLCQNHEITLSASSNYERCAVSSIELHRPIASNQRVRFVCNKSKSKWWKFIILQRYQCRLLDVIIVIYDRRPEWKTLSQRRRTIHSNSNRKQPDYFYSFRIDGAKLHLQLRRRRQNVFDFVDLNNL